MPLKTHTDEQPALNLTPMIDVTFLIVIFFLVGTKFVDVEKQMDVQVPQVSEGAKPLTAAPQRRIVNVAQDGTITLDRQTVTLEQLQARLENDRSQYPDLGVVVRGDAYGDFQRVVDVLNAIRHAGIVDMGIAVRPVEDEKVTR